MENNETQNWIVFFDFLLPDNIDFFYILIAIIIESKWQKKSLQTHMHTYNTEIAKIGYYPYDDEIFQMEKR